MPIGPKVKVAPVNPKARHFKIHEVYSVEFEIQGGDKFLATLYKYVGKKEEWAFLIYPSVIATKANSLEIQDFVGMQGTRYSMDACEGSKYYRFYREAAAKLLYAIHCMQVHGMFFQKDLDKMS